MFGKRIGSIMVIVFFVFLLAVTQAFGGSDNMEKAALSLKANMPDKAMEFLKKEISENPGNAEAHYRLGLAYLRKSKGRAKQKIGFFNVSGAFDNAIERFIGASSLNEKYREKAVGRLFDLCIRDVCRGDVQNAYDVIKGGLYRLGVSQKRVVDFFWKEGEKWFQRNDHPSYRIGHRFFRIAYTEAKHRKSELAGLYIDHFQNKAKSKEEKDFLWSKARKIDPQRCQKFLDRLHRKRYDKEFLKKIQETKGLKLVSKDHIKAVAPSGEEAKVSFVLKKGKMTPWIIVPEDSHTFHLSNEQDVIIYEKGRNEKTIVGPDHYYKMRPYNGAYTMKIMAPFSHDAEVEFSVKGK
jgi:hypothetical protein